MPRQSPDNPPARLGELRATGPDHPCPQLGRQHTMADHRLRRRPRRPRQSRAQLVIFATHAAYRDPAAFDHPDDYHPNRSINRHIAFGFGVHQCLGQPLARLELQVVHPALLRRFPTMRLAVDPAELSYRDTMPMFGLNALPVTW